MRKIFIGDDSSVVSEEELQDAPASYEHLQHKIHGMDIYADAERYGSKGKVKVMDNAGTTMMLAEGGGDKFWLQQHSYQQKK